MPAGHLPITPVELTDGGDHLSAQLEGVEVFRYVLDDLTDQVESPRPYLHPLRSLDGDVVSIYRPHDHLWHRGLSLALPNVGEHNFWGGVTYTRDQGYVQLPNNGRMANRGLDILPGGAFFEEVDWVTEPGDTIVTEKRQVRAAGLGSPGGEGTRAWGLSWTSDWTNATGGPILFGSPTTEGRPMAGYGGFFWRGPRDFTGAAVLAPETTEPADYDAPDGVPDGVPEQMGLLAPWIAITGRHDGSSGRSTFVMADSAANTLGAGPWFVRSTPYACISTAPFFFTERVLEPGQTWNWRHQVAVSTGALDVGGVQALVDAMVDL
jgi:methane monooxygenase PmoA-like